MSRRGNGLTANAYTPLADLTPQLADAMLAALREAGIAAYAVPAPGELGGYLDVRLPEEPTDRLYADASARAAAEEILESRLPELRADYAASRDEDQIFAEIVASFDRPTVAGDETPWPAEENIDESSDDGPDDPDEDTEQPGDSTAELTMTARVVKPATDDDDEHYIPPPPPPLPRPDAMTRIAWIALLGGPIYLVISVFLGWDVPSWAAFVAVAAFIGGFVALVLRMGDEPPDDDDNGAVV